MIKLCRLISLFAQILLLIGLVMFFGSIRMVDRLPKPQDIDRRLRNPPVQIRITRRSFEKSYDGKLYKIQPRYSYRIYGLVVSARDLADTWYNIDYFKDPLNVKDLCVIWGDNLTKADYRAAHFSSGLWTCYYKYDKGAPFRPNGISNNHILPADGKVMKVLKRVREGDQIFIKGMLVDYESEDAGNRQTSTTRNDQGNHACEVIYATEMEIVKDANTRWRIIYRISKYLIPISIIMWLLNFIFSPLPKRKIDGE